VETQRERLNLFGRQWTFVEVVAWFETEGSVFVTCEDGEEARIRVVVSSQGEDGVIRSIWEYLRRLGFHPSFRAIQYIMKGGLKRKRAAECEILRNLEQECFLEHALPFIRTEKRRKEVASALGWLRKRRSLPDREFKQFSCPKVLVENVEGNRPSSRLAYVRRRSRKATPS
jgi:hypothetical protein